MGYLHSTFGGDSPCSHGNYGFCRECTFPAEKKTPTPEPTTVPTPAPEPAPEPDEETTPFKQAWRAENWEEAYALLPDPCWFSVYDPDGYPPQPQRVRKPSFGKFFNEVVGGWRMYSPTAE
jgi:hypothetical protein